MKGSLWMCQISFTVPPSRSTGGVFSSDRAATWTFHCEPPRTPKDTWWWLVVAAILLPLDIALRRLSS